MASPTPWVVDIDYSFPGDGSKRLYCEVIDSNDELVCSIHVDDYNEAKRIADLICADANAKTLTAHEVAMASIARG